VPSLGRRAPVNNGFLNGCWRSTLAANVRMTSLGLHATEPTATPNDDNYRVIYSVTSHQSTNLGLTRTAHSLSYYFRLTVVMARLFPRVVCVCVCVRLVYCGYSL